MALTMLIGAFKAQPCGSSLLTANDTLVRRRASTSWTEGLDGATPAGGSLEDWRLDELDALLPNGGLHGANMAPRMVDYANGHLASPDGVPRLRDYASEHAPVLNGIPRLPDYAGGHAASCGQGTPSLY